GPRDNARRNRGRRRNHVVAWRNDPRGEGDRLPCRNWNLRCHFYRRGPGADQGQKFHPFLYWLTIVATTTVGTTLADYCTRSLGIGYTGGSTILLICVIASLLIWRWSPAVREYAAGISVDDTEQSAQRIIKTD